MSPVAIVGVAGACGVAAVIATPWLVRLARKESPLLTSGLHPLLAALGGAGAAVWADSVIEVVVLAFMALVCGLLVTIDLAVHRLPNALVAPAYPVVVGAWAVQAVLDDSYADLGRALLAGLALAGGYLVLALISPSGLGMGDVKLAGLLGIVLGWYGWEQVLAGTIAAFVLGGLAAVVLLVTARADRRTHLAFGPWMTAGAVVGLVWGSALFGS